MFLEDRTVADWKMSLSQPAAGEESCFAGFLLTKIRVYSKINRYILCDNLTVIDK